MQRRRGELHLSGGCLSLPPCSSLHPTGAGGRASHLQAPHGSRLRSKVGLASIRHPDISGDEQDAFVVREQYCGPANAVPLPLPDQKSLSHRFCPNVIICSASIPEPLPAGLCPLYTGPCYPPSLMCSTPKSLGHLSEGFSGT